MTREARRIYRLNSLNTEEINRLFAMLADRIDELEGRRGTPAFKSNVNMGSNRITSLGTAQVSSDAISLGGAESEAASAAASAASGVAAEIQAANWYNRKVVDSNGTTIHGFDVTNI